MVPGTIQRGNEGKSKDTVFNIAAFDTLQHGNFPEIFDSIPAKLLWKTLTQFLSILKKKLFFEPFMMKKPKANI